MRAAAIKLGAARIPGAWLRSAVAQLPGDGAIANIVAIETAIPTDFFRQTVGLLLRPRDGAADGRCAKHAAAVSGALPLAYARAARGELEGSLLPLWKASMASAAVQ